MANVRSATVGSRRDEILTTDHEYSALEKTRAYVARRTTEGKTPREIKRCLARYVARDLYRLLENGPAMA